MNEPKFVLPDPDLQVTFSELLLCARTEFLQQALLRTVAQCDIRALDREAHSFIPPTGLKALARRGLRAELMFALPMLIRKNPRLLAYYRLVLGFSQKAFYGKATGFSGYKKAEEGAGFSREQEEALPELCMALNRAAAFIVASITDALSAEHIDDLSLLTFGPQLRGSRNVSLGTAAIREVFEVIRDIIGARATQVQDRLIAFTDSTGRAVEVRFGADPDIEAVSVHQAPRAKTPLLAIEVKGGTDLSNVHNRLGEAEKSHLKAKNERGFTDLWTIVNVQGLPERARGRASPTTTAFFDLADVVARSGEAYDNFRERLLQKLRLPE